MVAKIDLALSAFYGVVFDDLCTTSEEGYDTMHMALAVE